MRKVLNLVRLNSIKRHFTPMNIKIHKNYFKNIHRDVKKEGFGLYSLIGVGSGILIYNSIPEINPSDLYDYQINSKNQVSCLKRISNWSYLYDLIGYDSKYINNQIESGKVLSEEMIHKYINNIKNKDKVIVDQQEFSYNFIKKYYNLLDSCKFKLDHLSSQNLFDFLDHLNHSDINNIFDEKTQKLLIKVVDTLTNMNINLDNELSNYKYLDIAIFNKNYEKCYNLDSLINNNNIYEILDYVDYSSNINQKLKENLKEIFLDKVLSANFVSYVKKNESDDEVKFKYDQMIGYQSKYFKNYGLNIKDDEELKKVVNSCGITKKLCESINLYEKEKYQKENPDKDLPEYLFKIEDLQYDYGNYISSLAITSLYNLSRNLNIDKTNIKYVDNFLKEIYQDKFHKISFW